MTGKTYMVVRGFEVDGRFFNSGQTLTENQYTSIPPNFKAFISENTPLSTDWDLFNNPPDPSLKPRSKNSLKRL